MLLRGGLLDDPTWREYGFVGGLFAGAALAAREFVAFLRRDTGDQQRRITPQDVLDEARSARAELRSEIGKVRANQERLEALFDDFKDEESRVHDRITADVREALRLRNSNGVK